MLTFQPGNGCLEVQAFQRRAVSPRPIESPIGQIAVMLTGTSLISRPLSEPLPMSDKAFMGDVNQRFVVYRYGQRWQQKAVSKGTKAVEDGPQIIQAATDNSNQFSNPRGAAPYSLALTAKIGCHCAKHTFGHCPLLFS